METGSQADMTGKASSSSTQQSANTITSETDAVAASIADDTAEQLSNSASVDAFNTVLSLQVLAEVPADLRITFLHIDDDIIVIDKPANLRSVPGNSKVNDSNILSSSLPTTSTSTSTTMRKRKRHVLDSTVSEETSDKADNGQKLTAQQAWALAIRQITDEVHENNPKYDNDDDDNNNDISDDEKFIDQYIANLGTPAKAIASVPRQLNKFKRYIHCSRLRVFGEIGFTRIENDDGNNNNKSVDDIVVQMHQRIVKLQQQLKNAPTPTSPQESAQGQIQLLLQAHYSLSTLPDIYVIHRLDCATFGVMVFCRNAQAASFLGMAWRERECVHKTYRALVRDWPECTDNSNSDSGDRGSGKDRLDNRSDKVRLEGEIDIALQPSEYAIKWQVVPNAHRDKIDSTIKPCLTKWTVLDTKYLYKADNVAADVSETSHVRCILLELTPVTGRTHQLRLHCAAHCKSGIIGDDLYGENSTSDGSMRDFGHGGQKLCLHAYKLTLPHPKQANLDDNSQHNVMTFTSKLSF